MITGIALPDGTSYSFGYDTGTTAGHYGELTSITLRTGGTVTYNWTNFSDSYGNVNRWVSSRVSGGGTWTYTPSVIATCTSTQVAASRRSPKPSPAAMRRSMPLP